MADDLPGGLQLTALDPAYRADPYPRLQRLREACPVRHDEMFGTVTLTRYADVRAVLTDRTLWRDPERGDGTSLAARRRAAQSLDEDEFADSGVKSILMSDDPDHGRVRGLITPVLYKRFAASRGLVDKVVRGRLDAIADTADFDLMAAFAVPVPIEVIAHVLGVDEARLEEFRAWSEAVIQTFNPARSPEQTEAMITAHNASIGYLDELMQARRRAPRDDLVTDLVQLQAEGGDISDAEIRVNCNTLLVAGNLTTTDLIGNGVRLLLTHRDQLDKLLADPALINKAVEEILRYDPPVDSTGRVASRDMEVGGCPIARQMSLSPSLRAANRDPDAFAEPDRFDITRPAAPHVAFGGGAHICLGAPLARMEAQSALLGLFQRFPDLRLRDDEPHWRALPFFRGLETLRVGA